MDGISIILCRRFSNTVEKNSVYDREQNLVGYLLLWNKRKKKYFKAPLPSLFLPAFKLFLSDIWFVLISFCFVAAFSCFRGNLINFKMWICYCCFWFWIVFTILYMDLFSKLAVFICYRGRVCERFVLVFLRLSRSYKLKMC